MQRKIAFNIIYNTIVKKSYSNLLMRKELDKLEKIQRNFVSELVNGVLRNYDYLVYQTKSFYTKTNINNEIILAMASYERFFMHEKDYVVNNEYVKLAKDEYNKSFINAILHKTNKLIEPEDNYIKESLPKWIYDLLNKQYEVIDFNKILVNYKKIPKVYYRLNPKKAKFDMLKKFDIDIIDSYTFTSNINLIDTAEFNDGLFYVQDLNAAKLIEKLELKESDIFLDCCSAPGSKLFNALEYIKEENAYSNDISEKRVNLIKSKAKLLGYNNVSYFSFDASSIHEHFNIKFDKILLDVPCSGLGVLSRKTDIKFHITPSSLDELVVLQSKILDSAFKLLKSNGLLLYSTCTLNKKENGKQIDKFINSHLDAKLLFAETIISDVGDMFYYALLTKLS